jgi:site-specific DNA recombinase
MIWKAILYIRQATADQTGHNTLNSQEAMLKNYCAIHNIEVVEVYRDICSGSNFDRPAFNKLFSFLEQNKEAANLLLFTTWDRFTRSLDTAIAMTDKLNDLGVEPYAIQKNSLRIDFLLAVCHN